MAGYQKYTELDVWKAARDLATLIYKTTATYPRNEQFGLVSQMRRCAVSVPSNIAEGCGREHLKETIHFLAISRASLYELETQLYISNDLLFINEEQLNLIISKVESLGKLINGFIRYQKSKL